MDKVYCLGVVLVYQPVGGKLAKIWMTAPTPLRRLKNDIGLAYKMKTFVMLLSKTTPRRRNYVGRKSRARHSLQAKRKIQKFHSTAIDTSMRIYNITIGVVWPDDISLPCGALITTSGKRIRHFAVVPHAGNALSMPLINGSEFSRPYVAKTKTSSPSLGQGCVHDFPAGLACITGMISGTEDRSGSALRLWHERSR